MIKNLPLPCTLNTVLQKFVKLVILQETEVYKY